MVKSGDVLVWQTLASVMIPGFVINRIVLATRMIFGLKAIRAVAGLSLMRFGPTGVGLGAIPFIIHPIDHGVDYLMDNTYRKML